MESTNLCMVKNELSAPTNNILVHVRGYTNSKNNSQHTSVIRLICTNFYGVAPHTTHAHIRCVRHTVFVDGPGSASVKTPYIIENIFCYSFKLH